MGKTNKTILVSKHLKEKGCITSWEAIVLYGATRLSAIIFNLRDRGYNIESVYKEEQDRNGNPCRFVTYVYRGDVNG